MLIAGELDAILSPPRPRRYHPLNGPIVRLFPDIRAVERQYFRGARIYPPQHLIVLRREVWQQNKWIAHALTDAFAHCTEAFAKAQRSFPYASPWLEAELEETEALMGADFHAEGYEQNRDTVDVFAEQAYQAGIVSRRISAQEYFAEFLES
jgi:4,5-dihydroxyphthalate decarboxylase